MKHRTTCLALACAAALPGWVFPVGATGVACLVVAQLLVLASCMVERRVSAVGSFVFMYVLFFAFRPAYFFIEEDWTLMSQLFRVPEDLALPYGALRWATLCLLCFRAGSLAPGADGPPGWLRGWLKRGRETSHVLKVSDTLPLLVMQAVTFAGLLWIIRHGGVLYGFRTGYVYDLPAPVQALHAFAFIFILQMWRMDRRNRLLPWALLASGALFVAFTIAMRSVSIFRLFYLTGFLVVCFAYLASRRKEVTYAWLVVPIIVALPIFDVLGRNRFEDTASVSELLREDASDLLSPRSYWEFFDSTRDMNIFDSYTAALHWETDRHPYFLQWLYPAVHWVPRKLWKGKPEGGILIDLKGPMRGAPYSPGINGIFHLGGGHLYMLLSMGLLGYCVARADASIRAMREGVLKWTFYGTFVVNTMLLTRFFLFQFVWQVLYVVLPCVLLNLVLMRRRDPRAAQASIP